jgi:hypothetical protein
MSGYTRNAYVSDPFHAIVGTVTIHPDMLSPAPAPKPWTDPFIVPPVGYEAEAFDIRDLGAASWYIVGDGYGTPDGTGWRYSYRFADELQALLHALLLRARRVPYQQLRVPQSGRPDWPTIVTDLDRLDMPTGPTDAPFTGLDFQYLFHSQAHVDPEAAPAKRLWGLDPSDRAGLTEVWIMAEGLTVARLIAQFLESSGIPHALAGDPVDRLVVFTRDAPEWVRRH